ncbi:hypothetical protein V1T76_24115 [Roseibium sp. FZY0029]|uniref:hypothetical protein n=1 Tax=Roseibium sp. FZY0029 TaxID=3116647 RepID=UPI002E9969FF|nr:hypothetical protein [Roseibium sp. FZY0029]
MEFWKSANVELVSLQPREPFLLEAGPNGDLRKVPVTSPEQYLDLGSHRDAASQSVAKHLSGQAKNNGKGIRGNKERAFVYNLSS